MIFTSCSCLFSLFKITIRTLYFKFIYCLIPYYTLPSYSSNFINRWDANRCLSVTSVGWESREGDSVCLLFFVVIMCIWQLFLKRLLDFNEIQRPSCKSCILFPTKLIRPSMDLNLYECGHRSEHYNLFLFYKYIGYINNSLQVIIKTIL